MSIVKPLFVVKFKAVFKFIAKETKLNSLQTSKFRLYIQLAYNYMFLSKRINTTIFPDGCFTRNNFKEANGKLNQLPQGKMPFAILFSKKPLFNLLQREYVGALGDKFLKDYKMVLPQFLLARFLLSLCHLLSLYLIVNINQRIKAGY